MLHTQSLKFTLWTTEVGSAISLVFFGDLLTQWIFYYCMFLFMVWQTNDSDDDDETSVNKIWSNLSILIALIISLCTSGLFHSMLTCDQRCSHNRSGCLVLPHQLSIISSQGIQIGVNSSYKQQTTSIQPWWRPDWRACLKTPHERAIMLTKSQNLSLTWTNVDISIWSDKWRRE